MDRQAIRKFATWARRSLKAQVSATMQKCKIIANVATEQAAPSIENDIPSPPDNIVEDFAYELFYRICALRYMEVNGVILPKGFRSFTEEDNTYCHPMIALSICENPGMLRWEYEEALDAARSVGPEERFYRTALVAVFRYLSDTFPNAFRELEKDEELFCIPDELFDDDGVIARMISEISLDDWREGVEILGWLYQYYFEEKRAYVIDPLASKTAAKGDIPVATQIFTPEWVVRYMVDNSLGRYWLERSPQSRLRRQLTYYVASKTEDETRGEPTATDGLAPESVKILDPCVGSAHILLYAFDVLMAIYRECGYDDSEAVCSIVEHNLYGIDIDDRVVALAHFAILVKASQYDKTFLERNITPHLYAIQESNDIEMRSIDDSPTHRYLVNVFDNAKTTGTLIAVENRDYEGYISDINKRLRNALDAESESKHAYAKLKALARQAKLLSDKYTIVCTNPPYMNKHERGLKDFLTTAYKDYSGDLFSAFIYRNMQLCEPKGYCAYMTPNVWMFIKTYKKLRHYIIRNKRIVTLIQMAKGAFFNDATVDICAFVLKNARSTGSGTYFRLEDFHGNMEVQKKKVLEALSNRQCGYVYTRDQRNFEIIPGYPLAYWISPELAEAFRSARLLNSGASPRQGLATTDNKRFLRRWHEVAFDAIAFHCADCREAQKTHKKWFPYNKGGEFRKWYGNAEYIVNYQNNGEEIIANVMRKYPYLKTPWYVVKNTEYYFQTSLSWSKISSGCAAFRYFPQGFIFDVSGCSLFHDDEAMRMYHLGLLNSKVTQMIFEAISPTLNYEVGHIANLPVLEPQNDDEFVRSDIIRRVEENIAISKLDWDSRETSWDFRQHPFLDGKTAGNSSISAAYASWKSTCEERFESLKANEEAINRIFIDIYGLKDILSPDVLDKYVSVHRIFDTKQDAPQTMKGSSYIRTKRDEFVSFLSYAVGCMFGRYRLDANGVCDPCAREVPQYPWFASDNVLAICHDNSFEDDIASRFFAFVETVYGSDTLEANLDAIAQALGGSGSSRDVIRRYFSEDFYADHVKMYGKRPIYWLFDSGKNGGFGMLISMHRYRPDVFERMRERYVKTLLSQARAQADVERPQKTSDKAERNSRKKKASGSSGLQTASTSQKLRLKALEQFDKQLRRLIEKSIEIDLDDGVAANAAKFSGVLAAF